MDDSSAKAPEPDGAAGKSRLATVVLRLEEILFTLILATFLVAGLTPIICRHFDLPAVLWAGDLSKYLILAVALFGAGAATRDRKHITIDAVSQFLPPRGRIGLRAATELFAALVCGVLVPASILLLKDEIGFYGDETTSFGVPRGWLPAIVPLGLSALTLRFLIAASVDFRSALKPSQDEAP